jgi:F-type H+-transporting ATPase subunit b
MLGRDRCLLPMLLIALSAGRMAWAAPAGADDAPAVAAVATVALADEPADRGAAEADDPHADATTEKEPHAAEASHEGEHAHHDPYDLSHANAGPKLQDPTEWRYDTALCTFAVFVVLLIVLRLFAWRPILSGLIRREMAIASRIDEAERNAQQAAAQLEAYREKMLAAAQEAQEVVAKARRDGEALADKIRDQAREDASRERERAIADIQAAKNAALRDMAQKGADLAVLLAGRIIRRELNPEDHANLIAEALDQFPSKN